MAVVQPRPTNMSQGLNSLEKNAKSGPNVTSYGGNYDKFPMKTAPVSVPNYKMSDPNKWQNTYGNMQKNSHPDFKPIYGPQDNKRPADDLLDIYKQNKDHNNQPPKKPAEERPTKGKEVKESKLASPKKGRETPMKAGDVDDDFDPPKRGTPRKDNSPKQKMEKQHQVDKEKPARVENERQQNRKPAERSPTTSPSRRPYNTFDKNSPVAPNIKPYDYNKVAPVAPNMQPYKDNKQNKPVATNIRPYDNDYNRKFPVKTTNMTVPEYKLNQGNKWQKSYSKMQSGSHPDFHPVYGPQDNKRQTDLMDVYAQTKQREKKPEEKKKETKEQKPVKEDEITTREDQNKKTPDRSPKKAASPKETPRREQHKEQDSPRKDPKKHEESPRREMPTERKHNNRQEEKVPAESPRKKHDDNDEKYYGYEERPVRNDKKEPGNKEVKFTPIVEKKDKNKDNKDKKKDEKKDNKTEEKETLKDKKDPYDDWVHGKNKVNERKHEPYDYRRKEEEKQKSEAPKRQKDDPYSYRPRDDSKENTEKQPARAQAGREGPRKDTSERKPQEPRRDREVKPRQADNPLYTSQEHVRPTKTHNNNTSIVRDGSNPKQDRRNKPTAKVRPTARDWGGEKWSDDTWEPREAKPARARFYQNADMHDVLQDKIATQLRENGIAETKVVPLSAKITQAVCDDVIDANKNLSPQVASNLTEVIHKHLDPILYNKANMTDLRDSHKANDAQHLSDLVLMRMGQVHEEIDLCKLSVDDLKHRRGKAATPRDDLHDRSMLMAIKDGIEKQKTERDILRDKLNLAHRETQEVEGTMLQKQGQLQHLDSDNWQLRQDLDEVEQTKQSLESRLKEQARQCEHLDRQNQDIRQENLKLRSRVNETEGQNHNLSSELSKLQSENAKLKVLTNQKEKEILHLRDPDKDMVHKIRILSDEVTMLRTQTRRLNEEKALLKSRSQKMESSLDESNRQKGKLSVERDNLQRENLDLKQRYRKLALANPNNRALPDINTGRSGPSSYSSPRSNSRAPSRGIRQNNERMSAALEDEEDDDDYHR